METEQKTILIVDDVEDDAHILEVALKRCGVQNSIRLVGSGKEAISYLAGRDAFTDRAAHPLPAVVFLDLQLPDMHGMEVLRWISSQPNLRRILVVVHSGLASTKEMEAMYAAGANSFLRKSNDLEELKGLVAYFQGHFNLNEKNNEKNNEKKKRKS